jgi:molybdopterin-guanine dinucleotide biosynthesis protein A
MTVRLFSDITGIILVGGKSRRMGRDKAFLTVAGVPLFERVLTAFRSCFTRLLLIGDRAERFTTYAVPVVPDIYPGSALGGLYTGLQHAESRYVFVSSCDLPFPSESLIRGLCALKEGYDAVVPVTAHGYEPLFALYAKSCLDPIKALLDKGEFCAYDYYPQINARYVQGAELSLLDPSGTCFININTPEDFNRLAAER